MNGTLLSPQYVSYGVLFCWKSTLGPAVRVKKKLKDLEVT